MKFVRPLLIVVGAIALLGVVVTALALTPSVQHWLLARYAARHPGLHLEVDSIAAGPSAVALRGVRFAGHGVKVAIDRIDADYALLPLLFDSRLEMDRLQVSGVMVDGSHASRNKFMAAIVAAPATVLQLSLPVELAVGDIHVVGQAKVPGSPGRPQVQADFVISGGRLAPGREGTIRLTAHLVDPQPGAGVSSLDARLGLQLKQSLAKTFERVALTSLLDASGPKISGQSQLKVAAEVARTLSGQSYLIHVDTLIDGKSDDVLALNARQVDGNAGFAGDWLLTAHSEQIEPFFIGGALPKFDVHGNGSFHLRPATGEVGLQGSLQAGASELELLLPSLRPLGSVRLRSEFDLAADPGGVELNRMDLSLAGERPVLEMHTAGALGFTFKDLRIHYGSGANGRAGPAPGGEILRLKLTSLPFAWLRPFIHGADVSGDALSGEIAFFSADGRRLVARTTAPLRVDGITVVRHGHTLVTKAIVAADAEADFADAGTQLLLRSVNLRTAAGDWARFQATVSTKVADPGAVDVVADVVTDFPSLVQPWLPGVRLRTRAAIDCSLQGGRVNLRKLSGELTDDGAQRLAAFALTHPFAVDLANRRTEAGPGLVELGRITIGRLPLGPLLRGRTAWSVAGFTSPDEFVLSADNDELAVSAATPLLLSEVSLGRGAKSWFDRVSLEFSPNLRFASGELVAAGSGDALIRDSSGAPLAKVNAAFDAAADGGPKGTVSFNIDLPTLGSQPLQARAAALSAGTASGELRAVRLAGGAFQLEARATLNGLVAQDGARTLPVANLGLRGMLQADGRFSLQAPILLDSAGRRSDLNVTIDGATLPGATHFDAHLSSDQVDLGAILLLASAAGEPLGADEVTDTAAQARALSPPAADERPFWAGWNGQLAIECKQVVQGADWAMKGVAATVTIADDRLELTKAAAGFGGDGTVTAQGSLVFAAGLNPYHLDGSFTVSRFDAGAWFRALDAERAPTLEGICDLKGSVTGEGLTLDDTIDRARARADLSCRKGVFRGLRRAGEKLSMASKAVEWSAALGSILKTGKVKEAAEKVAGNGYYVDLLAQALAEFPFDQLDLKLVRDESLNVQLQDIALLSQEIRMTGQGQITHQPGKRLLEQPLTVSLNFASRGRIEQLLGRLHVLDGSRDELDYARVKEPVLIGGTLAKPDPVSYYAGLLTAKVAE